MRKSPILRLIIIVIFLCKGIYCPLFAQQDFKEAVSPSPTAASLGKFGDYPVGYYTGVPNISIPLTTLTSGKVQLPISISYHASGIKVDQEASWVGLGWSLFAGGVISRQIQGVDDFKSNGFISSPAPPAPDPTYGLPQYNSLGQGGYKGESYQFVFLSDRVLYESIEQYHALMVDSQPDHFTYSFPGGSGQLLIGRQSNDSIRAIAVNQNNLRVLYIAAQNRWEVTDDMGTKYFFGTQEITKSASSTLEGVPVYFPTGAWSENMITGWYLDKIVDIYGNEINFIYTTTGCCIQEQVTLDQRVYHMSDLKVNGKPGFVSSSVYGEVYHSASVSEVNEVVLQRIDFKNGYLQFHRGDRVDRIRSTTYTINPSHSAYLDQITLHDLDGNLLKKFSFDYDYYNYEKLNDPSKERFLRLKLKSVKEFSNVNGSLTLINPGFEFIYDSQPLPAKNSFSKDLWGYYNGASNHQIKNYSFRDMENFPSLLIHNLGNNSNFSSSLIPSYTYNKSYGSNSVDIWINGANRDPDSVKAQAGVLKEIIYPTGGKTSFIYESNDYSGDDVYAEEMVTHLVTSLGTTEKTFTLSKRTFVYISFALTNSMYQYDPTAIGVMDNMTAVLEKTDGTDIVKFIPSDDQMDGVQGGNNNADQMNAAIAILLEPGNYRVKVNHGGYVYLNLNLELKYVNQTPTQRKIGPGVRIKSIENFDSDGVTLLGKKNFTYETSGESTGKLLSPVHHFYNETDLKRVNHNNASSTRGFIGSIMFPNNTFPFYWIVTRGGSVTSLGSSAQGSPLGYSSVRVQSIDKIGNSLGASVYEYYNEEDSSDYYIGSFFPGLPPTPQLQNGLLRTESHLDNEGNLVVQKEKKYQRDSIFSLEGVLTLMPLKVEIPSEVGLDNLLIARYYKTRSEWWHPYEEIERIYSDGLLTMETKIVYEYSNPIHKYPTKSTSTLSNGKTVTSLNEYPSDVSSVDETSQSVIRKMVKNNILSNPIRIRSTIDGVFVNEMINNYKINGFNHVVPLNKKVRNYSTGLLDLSIKYDSLDNFGNVLQVTGSDGVTTSYVWAYENSFPVVKAANVEYSSLLTATNSSAGTTNLNLFWKGFTAVNSSTTAWNNFNTTLRNSSLLSNRQISTYTYDPLIGMTSQTDPNGKSIYYKYDSNHRLKLLKNNFDEIIQSFKYNYITR